MLAGFYRVRIFQLVSAQAENSAVTSPRSSGKGDVNGERNSSFSILSFVDCFLQESENFFEESVMCLFNESINHACIIFFPHFIFLVDGVFLIIDAIFTVLYRVNINSILIK